MKNALVIIISFVLVSSSFAQEVPNREDLTHYALSSDEASNKTLQEKDIKEKFHKNISAGNEKSPVLGGVLSAIVPGAGEFYAKSYLKAAIFLAVEAGMWIGYVTFQNKGNDQEAYYKGIADGPNGWNVRKYATWLRDQAGATSVNPSESDLNTLRSQINAFESTHFSHQLPAYGTQQYYELIGKYQNFVPGWSDASSTISATVNYSDPNSYVNVKTPLFNSYSYDRQQANDYFDTSTRFITGVIINHVLSAADAVWSVHMFNSNLKVKTGLRVQERFGGIFMERYSLPMANVSVQF